MFLNSDIWILADSGLLLEITACGSAKAVGDCSGYRCGLRSGGPELSSGIESRCSPSVVSTRDAYSAGFKVVSVVSSRW